jgi:hypothetical protein
MSEHQAAVIIQLLEIINHNLAGVREELVEIKQELKGSPFGVEVSE